MLKKKGILLIHGFMGSPHEFNPVIPYLEELGYSTFSVTLPAHGDNPRKPLMSVSANELLNHCASEYHQFAKTVGCVYVVGHSLGGLCTLLTASLQPEKLKGVIAFAAPYEHAYTVNYPHGIFKLSSRKLVNGISLAIRDRIPFKRPGYTPLDIPKLLKETHQLFSLMERQLPKIRVPVHLAHSVEDLTVPYTEMEKIRLCIGNACPVNTTTLTQSGHGLFPASQDISEALQIILDFLENYSE
jgi:esterase/lipase